MALSCALTLCCTLLPPPSPPSPPLQAPVSAEEAERTRLKYLSPVYKIDEAEHRKLIEEAGQVCVWGGAVFWLAVYWEASCCGV